MAGATASQMHPKSPLRYTALRGAAVNKTNAGAVTVELGVAPIGGGVIKDVVIGQRVAGGGTSVSIDIQSNGVSVLTTAGAFTAAAGTNKVTNTAKAPIALTNPTGGTRPVLDATKVSLTGGQVITAVITATGDYSTTAYEGPIEVRIEPTW